MITSRNRAVVLLGLAFVVGLLAGGAGLYTAARSGKADFVMKGMRGPGGGGSGGRGGRSGPGGPGGGGRGWSGAADRVARVLDLSAATKDSMRIIDAHHFKTMDSLGESIRGAVDSLYRERIGAQVDAHRASYRAEIRALFTAPQRERYDSMTKADDERRRRQREQGPSGGRGRGPR